MKLISHALVLLVAPVMLAGCATYDRIKPAPAQSQPISIVYSNEGPSSWNDLPLGTYTVPNSSVIISGHQAGGAAPAVLFGVVGMLVQGAVNSSAGHSAVKDVENTLRVDLVPQASELTQKALAAGSFGQTFAATPVAGGPTLEINPYTVITFVSDKEVRPYVMLKATLKSGQKGDKGGWSARYIASSGKPVPLTGPNSLTADDGLLYKAALSKNLEGAINAMLDDIANKHVRDDKKMYYVETGYPFMRQRWGLKGYLLSENEQSIVFAPKIGDVVVFAGISVLDKSVITYHLATKDDEGKILDEGK